jgi:hypothetical protein
VLALGEALRFLIGSRRCTALRTRLWNAALCASNGRFEQRLSFDGQNFLLIFLQNETAVAQHGAARTMLERSCPGSSPGHLLSKQTSRRWYAIVLRAALSLGVTIDPRCTEQFRAV